MEYQSTEALFDAVLLPMLKEAALTRSYRQLQIAGLAPNQASELRAGLRPRLSLEKALNVLAAAGVAEIKLVVNGETRVTLPRAS